MADRKPFGFLCECGDLPAAHVHMPRGLQPVEDEPVAEPAGEGAGDEIPLHTVTLTLCEPCLTGAGGECHSPGCALWLNRAPDIPVTQHLTETEASAAHQRFLALIQAGEIDG